MEHAVEHAVEPAMCCKGTVECENVEAEVTGQGHVCRKSNPPTGAGDAAEGEIPVREFHFIQ